MVKVFNFSIALALAFALANASCSVQSGVDFVGKDIANKPAAKAEECCAKCQATQGCGAFTWTNFNGGTCWLKSSKGETKPNPDAFSAELTVDTCETEKDVDYVDNDVGNAQGKPEECCAKCQQKQGCAAYTWTDFQSGTCWLKSGRGETKASQGAISGVVGSLPTTAPPPTPDTVGKTVSDYMIKTWPVNIIASDTTCGTKCFSLDYGQVPAKSKPKGWEYTYGVAMDGLLKMYEKTGDKKYFDYVKGYIDTYAFNTTTNRLKLSLSQDSMQPMVLLPGVYNVTKDARYLEAMSDARGGIDAYPRNPSGAIWHKPANSNQQWLDGLYMSQPFLAEYAAKYANKVKQGDAATAFNIVTEQFLLAHEHLWDPVKKLHYHAWLQSADMFWNGLSKYTPFIGQKRSEFFWGRSIGWYFVSLMDVLEYLPQDHKDRAKMEEIAGLLAEGIAAQQDDNGLWYQILDVRNPPKINGGYVNETGITPLPNWQETSSSALFTYGFNKGMRLGVLPCQYQAVAKKGWEGVKTKVVKSGSDVIVKDTIAGMGVGATFNSYVNADFRTDLTSGPAPAPMDLCGPSVPQPMFQSIPKACKFVYVRDNVPQGIGAVILASIEMEYSQDEVDAACKNDHQKCTLVKDVDYAGNDIGNAPASKAEDCCAQCQNKKGCAAFTWTSYDQGTCWFKSSKGKGGVPSTGAISGSVAKNPNQQQ